MRYWYMIAMALLATGCSKDLLEPEPVDRGILPVTPYVAIGSTETAGFADGALHLLAQQYSYPALIARQLTQVGGVAFAQPLTVDSAGFALTNGQLEAKMELAHSANCTGETTLVATRRGVTSGTLASYATAATAPPYNNWAIPYLKTSDLVNTQIANTNAYFARTGADSVTILKAIQNRGPRLFTIWLGMAEILENAINKGPEVAPIQLYNSLRPVMDSLTSDTTVAGFIATLPDVTAFPFFNVVPFNGLELTAPQAADLNQLYAGTGMFFQAGRNPYVVVDNTVPAGVRQIKPNEKLMMSLPADSLLCSGLGSLVPISARYMLTTAELDFVRYQIANYNNFIVEMASETGISVVRLDALYDRLASGITVNGVTFDNTWLKGGFFSLDGLNPSARGAALIANEFIETMNRNYRAAVPLVPVLQAPGIKYP